jgi:hypothetical protein
MRAFFREICVAGALLLQFSNGMAQGTAYKFDTDVMLADRSVIRIAINANFEGAQPSFLEQRARNSVFTFLNSTARQITLHQLKNNSQILEDLYAQVKANLSAKHVYAMGYTLLSPPDDAFDMRSRTISAVLTSGESVELTFSTGSTLDRPTLYLTGKVYEVLSTQALGDLKFLQARVKQKCQEVTPGLDCPITSLKVLSRS